MIPGLACLHFGFFSATMYTACATASVITLTVSASLASGEQIDRNVPELSCDSMVVSVEDACLHRATSVSQHPEKGCVLSGMSLSRSNSARDTWPVGQSE